MMKTTRKLTSLLLALCMIVSIAAVGIVPAAAATYTTYAQDSIEGSNVLHCFDWSYNNIKANLADIAKAGYTAVQTSPVQQPKDYSSSWTDGANQWWKMYQPLTVGSIAADGTSWLGTKAQLKSLCEEADNYNIKVIVDIVANHVANNGSDGGGYSYVNSGVESDLQSSTYYHSTNTWVSDTNRYTITQYHLGMPDLNTANSTVQNKVLSLLKECIDCGVDGFRFDAAKHIELPTDTSNSCASDFWPTVLNGATSYAAQKGVDTPFYYGEILGGAGTDISNYTTYMAVTDNYTGDRALDKAYWTAASELADSTYYKGASASKSVLWVESHDTYMGSSGSSYFSNTQSVTSDVLNKAWAIIGARANSTGLFFARPNSTMGAASSDTNWKSTAVAEINKFKNHFAGTSEYLASSGNTAYIERGTKGVVISKLDGAGSVSLTANQMESGTYTDQITGNTFSVSNGKITGTVGSTGIAVVYNADDDAMSYITTSPLYLKPNSNWTSDSARFAMYLFNSATGSTQWVSMTSVASGVYSASVPSGNWTNVIFCRMDPSTSTNSWDNKWNQTADLVPSDNTNCYTVASGTWDEGGGTWSWYGSSSPTTAPTTAATTAATTAPTTAATTAATESSNTYTVYAVNNASWSSMKIHYWGGSSTSWPGVAMTSVSGTKVYSYQIPKGTTGIVFNSGGSGNSNQTADVTSGISDGAVFIINSTLDSSGKRTTSIAPTYYLVGSMNSWTNNDNYAFSIHASDSGKWEYKLAGVQLSAGDELKVHNSSDSWFPDYGDNYTVSSSGTYDIYFRPNGDGNSDWFESYIYLDKKSQSYTVTWKNYDGTVLATDSVVEGATPTYSGDTPTKESTEQYDYTFSGWSPAVTAVTGDVTYTAQFEQSERTFTVTWKNYDGTVLETDENVAYGATPSYNGATPTRSGSGSESYVFSGWSPTIALVTQDATYTARFSRSTRSYTITWVDGDGNTIKSESVLQDVMPQYTGTTPTKTATAQYSYTFNGTWTPGVVAAERDQTYTANFDTTVNTYTITFKNEDGTVLQSSQVAYGETPSYTGATPTKASTVSNTYTFAGWDQEITAVTGDKIYTATYTSTQRSTITVKFTDALGWGAANVYYWNGDSNNTWPGAAMTVAEADNGYGQTVYQATIPADVEGIIFNGGDNQTVDITTDIADGAQWYTVDEKEGDNYKVELVVITPDPTTPDPTVPATEPATQPATDPVVIDSGYYIIGSMTDWEINADYALTLNTAADGEEYYFFGLTLTASDQFKVVFNNNGTLTWYPDGMGNNYGENGEITASGTYDIYFRPNGDGGEDWFNNVIYVAAQSQPETQPATQPETQPDSETITVKFTDALGWGAANVYYWNGDSNNTWPGAAMTVAEADNGYGQTVYQATIPADAEGIIFNGNGNQTVDITTDITDGAQWYTIDEKDGDNYKVNLVGSEPPVQTGPVITTQPQNWVGPEGKNAKFTVAAEGDGLTYKWYYRAAGKTAWTATTGTKSTYTIQLTAARNNREYYCEITDANGKSVDSDVVSMSISPLIVTQPIDWVGAEGKNAKFTVAAEGEGLTYQWYYRSAGATKWNASTTGIKATYTIQLTEARNGREFYCKITDAAGNIADSDIVSMTIGEPIVPVITSQPTDYVGAENSVARFTVNATGEGNLTYEWYYHSSPNSTKWNKATSTKNYVTIKLTPATSGRQYYCKVTDAQGNSVNSDVVNMTIAEN